MVNIWCGCTVLRVYLVDHAWTYRVEQARAQLASIPELLPRMVALMDVSTEGKDTEQLMDGVLAEMWRWALIQ